MVLLIRKSSSSSSSSSYYHYFIQEGEDGRKWEFIYTKDFSLLLSKNKNDEELKKGNLIELQKEKNLQTKWIMNDGIKFLSVQYFLILGNFPGMNSAICRTVNFSFNFIAFVSMEINRV